MNAASPKFEQATLWDLPNGTSSPGLEAGPERSESLASLTTAETAPQACPASLSAPAANKKARAMIDTSGRSSSISPESAALNESLVSRLRERLASIGSMEYRQTWKRRATPSGRLFWEHTALARRIEDSACIGWPTASARDWKDTPGMATTGTNPDGSERTRLDQLPRVAALAAWSTPMAGTPAQNGNNESGNNDSSRKTAELAMAGWTTPQAHDVSPRGSGQKEKHGTKHGCADLNTDAQSVLGTTLPSSPAETENTVASRGKLNPAFSLWLMGFPKNWLTCGMRAMIAFPSRRGKSKAARHSLKEPEMPSSPS